MCCFVLVMPGSCPICARIGHLLLEKIAQSSDSAIPKSSSVDCFVVAAPEGYALLAMT